MDTTHEYKVDYVVIIPLDVILDETNDNLGVIMVDNEKDESHNDVKIHICYNLCSIDMYRLWKNGIMAHGQNNLNGELVVVKSINIGFEMIVIYVSISV